MDIIAFLDDRLKKILADADKIEKKLIKEGKINKKDKDKNKNK